MSICDKYLHFEDCFILGIKFLLQIYNGSMSERDLIGKYCGTNEQVVVVSELTLILEFRSDGSINGPGFNATYHPFSGKHSFDKRTNSDFKCVVLLCCCKVETVC